MRILILFLILNISLSAKLFNVTKVNDNETATAQKSPSITASEDGTLFSAWIDYRNNKLGEIYFSKSDDNGLTWSKNKFIFNSDIPNSKFQRYATIGSYSNNIYLSWMSTINAKVDVFFCKSTDRGDTFSNPIIVTDDESKYNQDFPVMAVDDKGGIHITAIDNRNLEQGKVNFAELMYTHSSDEGESWSKNKIISKINSDAGACECCWPAIDTYTDTNGNTTVSVLYRSNINNLRVSYLANSFDGGQNFETPIRIGFKDWIINSCPVSGPSIFYDNNGILHSTYKTINSVYYSSFDKNNIVRNETYIAVGTNPFVTFDHNTNQIIVTYENYENDKSQTRIVSTIDGISFDSPKLLLNNDLDISMFNCKLIENNNTMSVIWEDNSKGFEKNDIWFAEYTSNLSTVETVFEKPIIEYLENGDLTVSTIEKNSIIIITDLLGNVIYSYEAVQPKNLLKIKLINYPTKVLICNVKNKNYSTSQLIIK
jgi:hypothetical protein